MLNALGTATGMVLNNPLIGKGIDYLLKKPPATTTTSTTQNRSVEDPAVIAARKQTTTAPKASSVFGDISKPPTSSIPSVSGYSNLNFDTPKTSFESLVGSNPPANTPPLGTAAQSSTSPVELNLPPVQDTTTPQYTPYKSPDVSSYETEIQKLSSEPLTVDQDEQLKEAFAQIDDKYAQLRQDANRKYDSRKQEMFSAYSGVLNPLSSGGQSIDTSNESLRREFIRSIDQQEAAEKAATYDKIYNQRKDEKNTRITTLQAERDAVNKRAQDEFDRAQAAAESAYQNLYTKTQIQKTQRDLSSQEKKDQRDSLDLLLGTLGSQFLQGMTDEDIRALERSSGLPLGSLNRNSKTLAELESNAKSLMEVSAGASLFDPETGEFVGTAPGGSNGALTDAQINSTVNSIAGAFDNEPIVKSYNTVQEGYQTIKSIGVDTKSPADDIAFIYAFAKIMDPNSVVREGEYNTIQKYAQTWADNFGFTAKRIFSNTNFLSADAKQKMLNALSPKVQTITQQYQNVASEYQRQIDDAYAGKPRQITNYSAGVGTENIKQQYESMGFTEPYDEMVNKYGEEGVREILSSFSKPLSTGIKGSEVTKIKDGSRVVTSMGMGIATGIQAGSSKWKYGFDFVVDGGKGAPLKSPVNGTVIFAGNNGGYGNQVKVKLADGSEMWFSHLDKIGVRPGQRLTQGFIYGTQGNTGTVISSSGQPLTAQQRASGRGTHVDITVKKPNGGYLTSQQVAQLLQTQLV